MRRNDHQDGVAKLQRRGVIFAENGVSELRSWGVPKLRLGGCHFCGRIYPNTKLTRHKVYPEMFEPDIKNPTRRVASRRRRGGFFEFASEDLPDTNRVMLLYQHLVAKRRHPMTDCDENRLAILSAAEHAIRTGKPPLRLFNWMLANWDVSRRNITDADEDRAVHRLKVWRRQQQATSTPSYVSSFVASFGRVEMTDAGHHRNPVPEKTPITW